MIRLIKALNQFRKIRTASDETRLQYVFGTIAAMGSQRYHKTQARYLSDAGFVKTITKNPTLTHQICDLDALSKFPPSSLGRSLYNFVNSDDVDYAKFLNEYDTAGLSHDGDGVLRIYNERERELHDVIHVVFGYERTRFGEAATVITQYWQGGPSGFAVMTFAGALRYFFIRPKNAWLVIRALFNVWQRQAGIDVRAYPFERNLHKHINEVRNDLGIKPKSRALRTVLANTRWED